jgi:hypothetical protein
MSHRFFDDFPGKWFAKQRDKRPFSVVMRMMYDAAENKLHTFRIKRPSYYFLREYDRNIVRKTFFYLIRKGIIEEVKDSGVRFNEFRVLRNDLFGFDENTGGDIS